MLARVGARKWRGGEITERERGNDAGHFSEMMLRFFSYIDERYEIESLQVYEDNFESKEMRERGCDVDMPLKV